MPKIHITSCRQRNNFSAVSLTSVLSVLIKAHKKFSPCLYKDIYCHTDILKPYSDAYDYAEEAICFLCRFIGKKLGDLCIGKFGKPLPIRLACYRHLGRMLWKKYTKNAKYEVGSLVTSTRFGLYRLACVRQNLVFKALFDSVSDDKYFSYITNPYFISSCFTLRNFFKFSKTNGLFVAMSPSVGHPSICPQSAQESNSFSLTQLCTGQNLSQKGVFAP